jgi:uncharacterized phage-associated protein
MPEVRYKPAKFREMLLYLANKTGDDPRCGDKKLNKLLYFADVTAFRRRGAPIAGATYKHLKHGPIAKPFLKARGQLKAEERVRERKRPYHDKTQTCTEALGEPDTSMFDADELAILDEIVAKYWDYNGAEIEEAAHNEPGWALTRENEEIPYRAALIAKKASPRAVAVGHEIADRLGW